MTVDDFLKDMESKGDYISPNEMAIAKQAWACSARQAHDAIADAGSQHFDHDAGAYVDSFELISIDD